MTKCMQIVAAFLLAVPHGANTQEGVSGVKPLIQQFCFPCHGPSIQSAGIDFEKLTAQLPLVRNRETWHRVVEALQSYRMPPEGLPFPSEDQRGGLIEAIRRAVNEFDYSGVDDPGFEPLRRLTHAEYNNTIRDLFGIDLKPAERFTSELTGASGFENSANTLFFPPTLMERYIAATERLVEKALPEYPTDDGQRRARSQIFVAMPGAPLTELQAARKILERYLLRAFRRPPLQGELDGALAQYQAARDAGQSFEPAVKRVLAAALISPKFLFKVEAGSESQEPFRISDWELASRLSYFLWATMPDDELFELAARNKLHEPETLLGQVQRMLTDPRSETLGTIFAAQWLGFDAIGKRVRMGPLDYPWCTDTLMDAMRSESAQFFISLLRDNQPIARLIDAEFTFVNEELASTIYGMKGIQGAQMRRVVIDDANRGGILGQGSMLAVTSNYNQTSPVKRGHWILDAVLGTPPPPPPANVGVFKEEVESRKDLSFREKIALHSQNRSCQGCHSKIDPLGFSLENFDYFGRWRDDYESRIRVDTREEADFTNDDGTVFFKRISKKIDASGRLPDGTSFDGLPGLKRYVLEHRYDDLVRQTVSKTLAYALGRQLEYYDEPAVRKIIAEINEDGDRFQPLLRAVVTSYPFQYKKNPAKESQ